MGRKSNKKKIVRELVKEQGTEEKGFFSGGFFGRKSKKDIKNEMKKKVLSKDKKDKKKVEKKPKPEKKTPTKTIKSKKTSKKASKALKNLETKFHKHKKQIFSGTLVLIMFAIVLSLGYLLFQKAFRADPIAKFLPAESTIATIEINSNLDHQQLKKAFKLLEKHPEYSQAKLIEKIDQYLKISYENDLKLWLGREVGAALINSKNNEDVNTLYFAEIIGESNFTKFLSKYNPAENEYNGHKTYLIDGPYYVTVIDDYAFSTQSEEALYQLIDGQSEKSLYSLAEYRKINNNLPLNRVAFAYLNFESVNDAVFKHYPFLGEKGLSMEVVSPLLKIFKAEGISLISLDDNFAVQSFLSLSDKLVDNADYLSFQSKYNAKLLSYIPKDALFFWGGEDIDHQFKRFVELLSGGESAALGVFDNISQSYSKKYFGENISFNDDILPLFANEFSFVYENGGHHKLILELNNGQDDAVKIHEIASSFAELGAVFEPKIVEHKLEDGTVGREIVAVPKEILKSDKKYKDYTIFELNMGEENKGIFYSIVDNLALLSDSEESIQKSLDLFEDSAGSLRNTDAFVTQIEPVMKSSDEVSYLNVAGLIPIFLKDMELPEFISTISSLSSGRNYFNDGIVTINYLHIN